jgi:hypothetical protein
LFLGAASVSAGAACSGGHEDVVLPQAPTEVDAAYGIRAYGTFGGETKVLTFGGPTKTTGTLDRPWVASIRCVDGGSKF